MKKIGHQVHYIACDGESIRNGESSFCRLADGSILHAFTRYGALDWDDNAAAQIYGCTSADEGETWSESRLLFPLERDEQNNMSPGLFRMANGNLGIIYDRKSPGENGEMYCMPAFRCSADEGLTWSPLTLCASPMQYMVMVNDAITVLHSGRILVPLAICCPDGLHWQKSYLRISASDDNGRSWHWLPGRVDSALQDETGLQEPGIFERQDGSLWLYARTCYGYQYQAFSADGGASWTTPEPNLYFSSPDSPMRVKRAGERVVAVFNPLAYNPYLGRRERWGAGKRTPLCCAVSRDDGLSFDTTGKALAGESTMAFEKSCYLLEDDLTKSYCYPAVIGTKDGFLVSYYHSGGTDVCLHDTKIIKVYWSELE